MIKSFGACGLAAPILVTIAWWVMEDGSSDLATGVTPFDALMRGLLAALVLCPFSAVVGVAVGILFRWAPLAMLRGRGGVRAVVRDELGLALSVSAAGFASLVLCAAALQASLDDLPAQGALVLLLLALSTTLAFRRRVTKHRRWLKRAADRGAPVPVARLRATT